jgi:hypothetical protein
MAQGCPPEPAREHDAPEGSGVRRQSSTTTRRGYLSQPDRHDCEYPEEAGEGQYP